MWAWAFPDPVARPAQYDTWWRFWIEGALPHRWVWTADECATTSVWLPPGAPEIPPEDEPRLAPLLTELLGERRDVLLEAFDSFEAAHPRNDPHYYLSLVGTRSDARGRGIGTELLSMNLTRIDDEHGAAYLESTNPANLDRYERLGFRLCGRFTLPDDGPTVTTMWRGAR